MTTADIEVGAPAGSYKEFTRLLRENDIIDDTYPVTGCFVWLPDGFRLKTLVFDEVAKFFERLEYDQIELPNVVPGAWMQPLTQEIGTFDKACYWLRRSDGSPLNLFLTPTGESSVYQLFRRWIRTQDDLPVRIFQIGHTFRPHRRGSALINGDEFMSLAEGHGAFSCTADSRDEFERVCGKLRELHHLLGIPFLPLVRPTLGNLPVSDKMVSFETYLPSKRRSFNVGVVYHQADIYSRAIGVTFRNDRGDTLPTQQVTFGVSERAIAAMLDTHRDEHGLRFLSPFAPTQILVLPVLTDSPDDDVVLRRCQEVASKLAGYRVRIDHAGTKPIAKRIASARRRGIPLSIGISAESIGQHGVRLFLRTKRESESASLAEILDTCRDALHRVDDTIRGEAAELVLSAVSKSRTLGDVTSTTERCGIASFWLCESQICRRQAGDAAAGEILGSQLPPPPAVEPCVACGEADGVPVTWEAGLQLLTNGVAIGTTYVLVGCAISISLMQQRVIFLGHGATAVLGGFMVVLLLSLGIGVAPALLAAVLLAGLVGWLSTSATGLTVALTEKSQASRFLLGFVSLLIIQNLLLWFFGAQPRGAEGLQGSGLRFPGGVVLTVGELSTVICTTLTALFLWWIFGRSSFGIQARAVGESPTLADIRGIHSSRVIAISTGLASACAALAGVCLLALNNVEPALCVTVALKGMTAALLGGARIEGAAFAGLGLGVLESFSVYILPGGYRGAIVFGVLALFLLIRPRGLIGVSVRRDLKP